MLWSHLALDVRACGVAVHTRDGAENEGLGVRAILFFTAALVRLAAQNELYVTKYARPQTCRCGPTYVIMPYMRAFHTRFINGVVLFVDFAHSSESFSVPLASL